MLDNGIRVVSHEMPDHRSATLGIWVETGSRHEEPSENGISHFIEHLLFKGTERRTAAQRRLYAIVVLLIASLAAAWLLDR